MPSLPPPVPAVLAPAVLAPGSLAGRVVVLDPGHDGGNAAHAAQISRLVDAGGFLKACDTVGTSAAGGYPEHAFAWDVAGRTVSLLRAAGATVVLTRPDDSGAGPCINTRAAIGNWFHADAALSIHADGAPPGGFGFHVIAPGLAPDHGNAAVLGESWDLARSVVARFGADTGEVVSNYAGRNGLIRRNDLGGLNLTRVPKVLIECGNMKNRADAARLADPGWRQRAAVGLAEGIAAFLGR